MRDITEHNLQVGEIGEFRCDEIVMHKHGNVYEHNRDGVAMQVQAFAEDTRGCNACLFRRCCDISIKCASPAIYFAKV